MLNDVSLWISSADQVSEGWVRAMLAKHALNPIHLIVRGTERQAGGRSGTSSHCLLLFEKIAEARAAAVMIGGTKHTHGFHAALGSNVRRSD